MKKFKISIIYFLHIFSCLPFFPSFLLSFFYPNDLKFEVYQTFIELLSSIYQL